MKLAKSKDEWVAARKQLLVKEKELTRMRDALAAERRALPWMRVEKPYLFDTPQGRKTLADLFEGRSQLAVYHFMFAPEWEAGCKSCSFWAESFDHIPIHLAHRDITFLAVSRAPLEKLQRLQLPAAGARRVRPPGSQRLRQGRERRRVPHLLGVFPRDRRPERGLPVHRPCPQGTRREARLRDRGVAPPAGRV